MEFCRQKYWSRLPFPPPGDLPYSGIKPTSLVSPALAGGFFTTAPPAKSTDSLHHLLNKRNGDKCQECAFKMSFLLVVFHSGSKRNLQMKWKEGTCFYRKPKPVCFVPYSLTFHCASCCFFFCLFVFESFPLETILNYWKDTRIIQYLYTIYPDSPIVRYYF